MREMSVETFRTKLREAVEDVLRDHEPLRVTRRDGESFVVVGAEDWERDRETLYVLQNRPLMRQIAQSAETHEAGRGLPSDESFSQVIKRARWRDDRKTAAGLLSALEEAPLSDSTVLDGLDEAQRSDAPPEDPWRSD